MIDWYKVDWIDTGLHAVVAVVLMTLAWWTPFGIALLVTAAFYQREILQRPNQEWRIWKWGDGAKAEAIAPAAASFIVATILVLLL